VAYQIALLLNLHELHLYNDPGIAVCSMNDEGTNQVNFSNSDSSEEHVHKARLGQAYQFAEALSVKIEIKCLEYFSVDENVVGLKMCH
jgi:hypothetical protein